MPSLLLDHVHDDPVDHVHDDPAQVADLANRVTRMPGLRRRRLRRRRARLTILLSPDLPLPASVLGSLPALSYVVVWQTVRGHAPCCGRPVRDGAATLGADTPDLAHGPRTPEQREKR